MPIGRRLRIGLVALGLAGAVGLAALPVEGRIGPDVAVIDSNAVAASIGLISRVPAQSDGGINWTTTAISLDKAVAKAAGGTGGGLAETFFQSSSDQYRNPSLIGAQYPPAGTIPTEARGGSPEGTPGGAAATHVVTTEQPSADASAQGGRGGHGSPITMQGGTSSSHGELGADGVVVTRAVAVATGVSVGGGAFTIGSATTTAVTTVPPQGQPTTELDVSLTGVQVGGVPAELTDQGLRISDQVPVGPQQLAAFNAATAQLAAAGITVTAAPAVREIGAGQARAEGGGAVVRYTVTDQIGGDEEIVLAQARSRSTLKLAEAVPDLPRPELPPDIPEPVPAPSPPAVTPPAAPPGGIIDDGLSGSYDDTLAPFGPDAAGAAGPAGDTAPAASAPLTPTGPAFNLVGLTDDRALRRLRTGYRVILLLAAAGALAHLAGQRSRTS